MTNEERAALLRRYRDTMGLTRDGAFHRMHVLLDLIEVDENRIAELEVGLVKAAREIVCLKDALAQVGDNHVD